MERIGTTHAANVGSTTTGRKHSTDAASQRQRLLEWLRQRPITTIQARQRLDIMSPAPRILELRQQGFNIVTHWTTENNHRIAMYVLLDGGSDE
ncbi:helix-turn-helix domain-containing protein [Methylicorpusculum oleiharenae]|uniref:helix-turn-helix domain-containing protein n=1 Tax=Methylicorpusculum oleiharenae TaxID=1338687 RepID=UPI00135C9FE6|nr:helix-turn-helix domain-containing protein [Methylicorpusculum oleiharenae]MCD2449725.1 helix-turn-helix domain-containing protein [Methylicorpusculum oleiharenae]